METRTCYRCKQDRPLSMFYVELEARQSAKRGGKPWAIHCRICAREIALARRKPRQDLVDAIKLESGCMDCGLKSPNPEVYDMDHRPGVGKSKSVAALLTSGTMDDLVAEIAKCDVVCANCHRIRTRGRDHGSFGKGRGPA